MCGGECPTAVGGLCCLAGEAPCLQTSGVGGKRQPSCLPEGHLRSAGLRHFVPSLRLREVRLLVWDHTVSW